MTNDANFAHTHARAIGTVTNIYVVPRYTPPGEERV